MSISNFLVNDTSLSSYKNITCSSFTAGSVNLPYFSAIKNVNSTPLNVNVYVNTYDSKSGTLSDQFDQNNGQFIPSRSGLYLYNCKCYYDAGAPSSNYFFIGIVNNNDYNNTSISTVHDDYVGGEVAQVISGVMQSTANIPVSVLLFQNTASPLNVTAIEFTGIQLVAL